MKCVGDRYARGIQSNGDCIAQFLHEQNGSITLLSALSMIVLCGFLGIAVDVGSLRLAKENLQIAADAAAMAGSLEIASCAGTSSCSTMTTASVAALAENGFSGSTSLINCASNSSTALVITINNGPCAMGAADPNKGNLSYVEVVVSEQAPTYFMGVFGIHTVPVKARAEAGLRSSAACLYTFSTTGQDVLINGSTTTLTMGNCGIVDNSSSASAMMLNGSIVGASSVNIVGNYVTNGSATVVATPKTNAAPVSDPLSSLPAPSYNTSSCLSNPNYNSGSATIGPAAAGGVVCYNGLTINNASNLTLLPGVYVINGSFLFNGTGTISGTGVTLYFPTTSTYTDNGHGTVNLSAPTSGTYNGLLLYQDRSTSAQLICNASSTSNLAGILYAPASNVTINGTGNSNLFMGLLVGSLTLNGSPTIKDYSTLNASSPLSAKAALVQ